MLEPILCGPLAWAPLLPKLRGHFAEFLGNTSSAGLRILSSSTCVGLRYGRMANNSGFSRQEGAHASLLHFTPHHGFVFSTADLPAVRLPRLYRTFHFRPMFPSRVPTVLLPCGTGISTCCPSATLFSLTLGPDFPRADQLYPGDLGYSATRILTLFSLLIPAFSLLSTPQLLTVLLLRVKNAPLPMTYVIPELRWHVLAPDIFGAGPLD